jgi:hypothetical protein
MYLISEALAQVGYFGFFFGFFPPYLFYLSYSFYSTRFSYGSCYIMYPIACKTRGKRRMSGSPGFKSVKEKETENRTKWIGTSGLGLFYDFSSRDHSNVCSPFMLVTISNSIS